MKIIVANRFFITAALFSLFFFTAPSYAQLSDIVSGVEIGEAVEGAPLRVQVNFYQSSSVASIIMAYRNAGEGEYNEIEMQLLGGSAEYTIPGEEITPPYLEYYFILELTDGTTSSYPEEMMAGGSPLQLQVGGRSPKDEEIIILSPEPGVPVARRELLITVSLLRASEEVDKAATRLYFNGQEITQFVLFAEDLLVFSAENFPTAIGLGSQIFKIELYDTEGGLYHSYAVAIPVVTTAQAEAYTAALKARANIRGESRNETINDVSTWYNILTVDANANYENWSAAARLHVTSEEKGNKQPNNRYAVKIESDFLELYGGDHNPRFPSLILNGRRVRGFGGDLKLGYVNLQATFGEITRGLDGRVMQEYGAGTDTLGTNIIYLENGNPALVDYGTFKRNIFAIRPYFGSGRTWQFGLSYLHSKDDVESIEFGRTPRENVVVGSDFFVGLDNKRISLTAQAAMSVSNEDISTGTMDDELIEEVFSSDGTFNTDPEDIKNLKDVLSSFITFNQFLVPLKPEEMTTLSAEAALSLNYFNNFLKASYIVRGNDFESFGNPYTRTDVKGINILDRIRLIDNKLFLSLSYENLQDNVGDTKFATTTYQTFTSSVSIIPRSDLPNITLGYTRFSNDNELSPMDTLTAAFPVKDGTNRFSVQISHRLELGAPHQLSLSFVTSSRDDETYLNYDMANTSLFFNSTSSWSNMLRTNLNFSLNQSTIINTDYNYISLLAGAQLTLAERSFLLNANVNPSLGDLERVAFNLSAEYFVLKNLSLIFRGRYLMNSNTKNDTIVGLVTKLNLR